MESMVEVGYVRRVLLGLEGPYADPREATDTLDNLEELWRQLPADEERLELGRSLLDLLLDDDAIVASAAAVGLGVVGAHIDVRRGHTLERSGNLALDRSTVGPRTDGTSIRSRLALALAALAEPRDAEDYAEFLDSLPRGVDRAALLATLARRLPELVVSGASRWLTGDDSGVLASLASPDHRCAVASTVRGWTSDSFDAVGRAAAWQHWPDHHLAELLDAMSAARQPLPPPLPPPAS